MPPYVLKPALIESHCPYCYFWYFWLTSQNTTTSQVFSLSLFSVAGVFISFCPWRAAAAAAAADFAAAAARPHPTPPPSWGRESTKKSQKKKIVVDGGGWDFGGWAGMGLVYLETTTHSP